MMDKGYRIQGYRYGSDTFATFVAENAAADGILLF